MMLASPGQLLSVSFLATDPRLSAMAEEVGAYRINQGLAEEIYLMQPDLVIAGAFQNRATMAMLRRLGIPVVEFQPSDNFEDVRARIIQMGEVLHRPDRARALVRAFDDRLAGLMAEVTRNPRAVIYYANSFTAGENSLAGQILLAAGFANALEHTGFAAGGKLPLEMLAMTDPDAVITAQPYPGASRSEEVLDHPVVTALRSGRGAAVITNRDWVCGTPHVLRAIEALSQARQDMGGTGQ